LGTSTFEGLSVGGTWKGLGFISEGGNITFTDSRISDGSGSLAPAMAYIGGSETPGLVLRRSVLQANPTAAPAALFAGNANVTLDSSEVLGAQNAVVLEQKGGKTKTLTVAGSTIDAGNLGVADGGSVRDLTLAAGPGNSIANANVEGSILLEPQAANATAAPPPGNHAHIVCSNSDVPSQVQAETATEGRIACGAGSEGNTHSEPSALFASPITAYALSPSAIAIDSVPASSISLPFGLTPSSTDLAGSPRVVDGNGDCLAVQDRGALELQGHSAPCPVPAALPLLGGAAPKPVAGAITGLTISPSSFFAAPSGASVSAAARKRYGARIAYRDSQAATATFTVLRQSAGRVQGRSCRKPSRRNRHGRRCAILTPLGGFTHADLAGANSLHFSGRLKGRKLAPGTYTLRATPANAAGKGKAASTSFKIRR
jgi:hypothetical protein